MKNVTEGHVWKKVGWGIAMAFVLHFFTQIAQNWIVLVVYMTKVKKVVIYDSILVKEKEVLSH